MILSRFLKLYTGEIRLVHLKTNGGKPEIEELFKGFDEDVPESLKYREVFSIYSNMPYVITAVIAGEDNQ